jgi:glycerophosphoryl diester phosphodiesterase
VYAHRGARTQAADNTIAAFRLAVDQGAHGIELDAQQTGDGHVVVFHDDRHPDAGWISACRLSDLRRIDATIPTLDEAFDAIAPPCFVNLELKNGRREPGFDHRRHLAAAVLPVIDRHQIAGRLLVSSFDAVMVRRIRHLRPELLTAQLLTASDPRDAIEWVARAGHDAVNVERSWLAGNAAEIVARAGSAGLSVCAWTVNDPVEVVEFAAAGVAVVITDDPEMALRALNAP